jgi:hypothetical protein
MTAWPTVWHPRSSGLILNNFLPVQTSEVARLYNISQDYRKSSSKTSCICDKIECYHVEACS